MLNPAVFNLSQTKIDKLSNRLKFIKIDYLFLLIATRGHMQTVIIENRCESIPIQSGFSNEISDPIRLFRRCEREEIHHSIYFRFDSGLKKKN